MPDSLKPNGPQTTEPIAMRPREAAKALGLSERTLWSLTKAGEIPVVRIGRAVLYRRQALVEFLSRRQTRGA